MLKNFFYPEENVWLNSGQEYNFPDEIAKEFTGSNIAYAVNEPVLNKSLGSVKGRKRGKNSSKTNNSSR
jgi:hypothetical protein